MQLSIGTYLMGTPWHQWLSVGPTRFQSPFEPSTNRSLCINEKGNFPNFYRRKANIHLLALQYTETVIYLLHSVKSEFFPAIPDPHSIVAMLSDCASPKLYRNSMQKQQAQTKWECIGGALGILRSTDFCVFLEAKNMRFYWLPPGFYELLKDYWNWRVHMWKLVHQFPRKDIYPDCPPILEMWDTPEECSLL